VQVAGIRRRVKARLLSRADRKYLYARQWGDRLKQDSKLVCALLNTGGAIPIGYSCAV
jgi:hypothetical protein